MKTLKILIIALLLSSCSTDTNEELCDCIKETYRYEQNAVIGSNGLPTIQFDKVILSVEQVGCQDEQDQVEQGNGILFDIKCD